MSWNIFLVVDEARRGREANWARGIAAGTPFGGAEMSGRPNPYTICSVSSGKRLVQVVYERASDTSISHVKSGVFPIIAAARLN
jgi:hypothetical protein